MIYALSVDCFINKTWAHLAMLQYWCYQWPRCCRGSQPKQQCSLCKEDRESTNFNEVLQLEVGRLPPALHPEDGFHILCIYERIFISSLRKRAPLYLHDEYNSLLKWVKETNGKKWSNEESWENEQNNGTRQETCKRNGNGSKMGRRGKNRRKNPKS